MVDEDVQGIAVMWRRACGNDGLPATDRTAPAVDHTRRQPTSSLVEVGGGLVVLSAAAAVAIVYGAVDGRAHAAEMLTEVMANAPEQAQAGLWRAHSALTSGSQ